MNFRTDLALERREILGTEHIDGVISDILDVENTQITRIDVTNENGAKAIGKPIGKYVTVEVPTFSKDADLLDGRLTALIQEMKRLLPEDGLVLIAGLGNDNITPDALGPKSASMILATRHIGKELAKSIGLEELRPVAGIVPGVLGKTGIETGEIIAGIVENIKPSAVITIDALASRRLSRLGSTVQMSNTGVTPGSGVGNARTKIDEETVGVPVIAVGVPTVVDAATLAYDILENSRDELNEEELRQNLEPEGSQMMVTPREIDLVIERASKLISLSINCALQPTLSPEDMLALVN